MAFNEQILEGLRPNFFELVAQETMHQALRPAVEYLCKVWVQSRPDVFASFWKFADEFYLCVESALQLYFLKTYSASFAENFYSLVRVPQLQKSGGLSRRQLYWSLLCLVLAPYLRLKCDRLYLWLQELDDSTPLVWRRGGGGGQDGKERVKYLFFKVYPYLQFLMDGLKFVYRLSYLFEKSDCYSPLLWWTGVTLSRRVELSIEGDSSAVVSTETFWQRLLGNLIPLSVFALKFLEWWYSTERSEAVKMMTSLPVPPPPQAIPPSPRGIRLPSDASLCPLCFSKRNEPTTLASSGYVFCYHCILGYVRKHKQCPITCVPSLDQQLIRLYINE